jgi:Phage derived protein Gp49-like (DUF891)
MKVIRFLGDSRKVLREFPKDVRHQAGYQLERIQTGLTATDFKPMIAIGAGVEEIRISDSSGPIEFSILHGWWRRYTWSIPSRRRQGPHPSATLKLHASVTGN